MQIWKSMTACVLSLALLSPLTACSKGETTSTAESDSAAQSAETVQVDSDFTIGVDKIAEDMGAGWNLGNQLEANSGGHVDETVWGNPTVTQEMISMVADAGFKTIRVPVSYLSYIDDENNYTIDSAWLDRVEEVVQYCYNEHLYVIINMHGDGYNSITGGWFLCNGEDQDYIKEKYTAAWTQIADRFKDYDEHLIFESMNEEFDGTYDGDPNREYYSNINTYNQIFIDTVRASGGKNDHRYVLVPGWNTDIEYTTGDYGFELPKDDQCSAGESRLMVSVHCYTPWDYAGEENLKTILWGKKGDEMIDKYGFPRANKAKWGDETLLEEQFTKLHDQFVAQGHPVIIGEYGCIDKTSAYADFVGEIGENRAYFDGFIAGLAAKNGMIPVYWDNGYNGVYGFGLFNRSTLEKTQPEIIDTIIEAVANKDPDAGMDTRIIIETPAVEAAHAYIGLQTEVYTFRNAYSDAAYGAQTEHFNTLIKWSEENEIIDTGAKFEDAEITEDGTYTVGVSGYDFSADSPALNMLFVSTDFPFKNDIKVSDVVLKVDDTEIPIDNPLVMADDTGNFYIELVNKYNTDLKPLTYEMPKDGFSVTFTIKGIDSVLNK